MYYFELLYLIRSVDEEEIINSVREIEMKGSPLLPQGIGII
jgi:hypothetical protein